jgi:hypothetical protein
MIWLVANQITLHPNFQNFPASCSIPIALRRTTSLSREELLDAFGFEAWAFQGRFDELE